MKGPLRVAKTRTFDHLLTALGQAESDGPGVRRASGRCSMHWIVRKPREFD